MPKAVKGDGKTRAKLNKHLDDLKMHNDGVDAASEAIDKILSDKNTFKNLRYEEFVRVKEYAEYMNDRELIAYAERGLRVRHDLQSVKSQKNKKLNRSKSSFIQAVRRSNVKETSKGTSQEAAIRSMAPEF